MAPRANEPSASAVGALAGLLRPFPGRLGFAARLALICALTTLVVEIYQTPDAALTVYVAFFVMKSDRTGSIVTSIAITLLVSLVIGLVFAIAIAVIDYPFWRVMAIAIVSFCLTFAASASKLKPVAGIVALVTAYALDLLGFVPVGEAATRGLLYAWLFVGIPAGVSIVVNLLLGPSPRRLAERALSHRLHLAGAVLRTPDERTRETFSECLNEGTGELQEWLKLAGLERTSTPRDLAALRQAVQSTAIMLSIVDFVTRPPCPVLPAPQRERLAYCLHGMGAILGKGGYPVDVTLDAHEDEATLEPAAVSLLAEIRAVLATFAEPLPESSPLQTDRPRSGFFLPDAFTNPEHAQYALKTTGAAMFCYITYLLLDWPGIHTCFITCYIVSLGTAAETVEKQALRLLGCLLGAAAGISAILLLIPDFTSIGALMAIVFVAALASGWIAAGSPRISYVGFQLAFAFFLCVIQGAAPAFDMTTARDRVIGILFGNLVVAVVFTQIWPVSVARRIDPAIAGLVRGLAALASVRSAAGHRALAAETLTAIGVIRQDLDLTRYEPSSIRPAGPWLDSRVEMARNLSSLHAPLVIASAQAPAAAEDMAHRLGRLQEEFLDAARVPPARHEPTAATDRESASPSGTILSFVEAPMARLEQLVTERYGAEKEEPTHAPA